MTTLTTYDVDEVAQILKVSRDTVWILLRRGLLPGRKVGGQWRVWDQQLEEYLRGRWTPAQREP